jgi:hypothetical protein
MRESKNKISVLENQLKKVNSEVEQLKGRLEIRDAED